jgi:hypothetical protein
VKQEFPSRDQSLFFGKEEINPFRQKINKKNQKSKPKNRENEKEKLVTLKKPSPLPSRW